MSDPIYINPLLEQVSPSDFENLGSLADDMVYRLPWLRGRDDPQDASGCLQEVLRDDLGVANDYETATCRGAGVVSGNHPISDVCPAYREGQEG